MRTKDNNLKEGIIKYINSYTIRTGNKPVVRNIAQALEISPATVSRYLNEMASDGLISYDNSEVETNVTSKVEEEYTSVPLIGSIACGSPCLEEENIEGYYRLPEKLFGKGEFFILRAKGESMINAGIEDGDLVLIRKTEQANVGQIVVALTDENENTLKRYYPEPKNNQVRLKPENPDYQDIITKKCKIQGVAVKVLKDLE